MNQCSQMSIKKKDNWVRTNFRKENMMKILFSDEKLFDIDGICNSQNDRIWVVNRAEVDDRQIRKGPRRIRVKICHLSELDESLIFRKPAFRRTFSYIFFFQKG